MASSGKKVNKKNHSPADPKKFVSSAKAFSMNGDGPRKTRVYFIVASIMLITFICFSPALKNEFTNWDDPVYVTENPMLMDLKSNFNRICTEDVSCNYHPLTMFTLALEYKAVGLDPKLYHATNIVFHVLNTLLVFTFAYLLSRKRIWVAALCSLFFGIHPMHVESVAWVSERKDVLHTFFYFLALIGYMRYLRIDRGKGLNYAFAFVMFVLSLLSKATAVTLPVVMVLLDLYEGRKIHLKSLVEKIPFFALSILFGIISVKAQSAVSIASADTFTVFQRLMFASYGMMMYLIKFVFPVQLSAFYPYPQLGGNAQLPAVFFAAPAVIFILCIIVFFTIRKTKVVWFGFLFFFITIALVLQFISVGSAIVADRYSYIPYTGLLFAIGMGYDRLAARDAMKTVLGGTFLFAALIFCVLTYQRTQIWKDNITLWTDVISKYPTSEVAYKNRGNILAQNNELDKALNDFNTFIAMNQKDAKIYSNRGNIYGLQGKFDLAMQDYSQSIQLEPDNLDGYFNRAITYSMMKDYDRAIQDFSKCIALKPGMEKAYKSRGYSYLNKGDYGSALKDYDYLLEKTPGDHEVYYYRGFCFFNMRKIEEAILENSKAIGLNPSFAPAYYNRSVCYKESGRFREAYDDAVKSRSLGQQIADSFIDDLKKRF